jgi:ribosomal protein S18 acetylase RimI-like enzyme
VGVPIDARINAADHPAPGRARAVLEAAGFGLLQEKEGFVWTDDGTPVHVPARLTFRSLRDVGEDAFIAAMAAGCAATLDRNDRYFYALVGPEGWGREMMGYAGPGDEDSWWLAHDVSGALVGYVMLSPFGEEGVGTIAHIGVVPGQRGRGYVHDLLQRTNAGAQERGFSSVLSDVDVRNAPMLAAMERAGHHAGVRPWHIWHYRWPPPVEG